MQVSSKKAFTMIELIFVIVVIGILSAIAIPKLAATRDDATITKARTTIASVRAALSTERQKRILRGDFSDLVNLGGTTGDSKTLFNNYDNDENASTVLEYPITSCASGARGCWTKTSDTVYTYRMPHNSTNVAFTLDRNKFRLNCVSSPDCKLLTE